MKVLLLSLLIMAPLYLLFCKAQPEKMDALLEAPVGGATDEQPGADSTRVNPLKPYQQQLEQAKGMETMLNQGLENRMRDIDTMDGDR